MRGLNSVGLQRGGFSKEQVSDIRKVYKHLFKSGGKMADKISSIPSVLANQAHISALTDFIKSSERGVCTPSKSSVEES